MIIIPITEADIRNHPFYQEESKRVVETIVALRIERDKYKYALERISSWLDVHEKALTYREQELKDITLEALKLL